MQCSRSALKDQISHRTPVSTAPTSSDGVTLPPELVAQAVSVVVSEMFPYTKARYATGQTVSTRTSHDPDGRARKGLVHAHSPVRDVTRFTAATSFSSAKQIVLRAIVLLYRARGAYTAGPCDARHRKCAAAISAEIGFNDANARQGRRQSDPARNSYVGTKTCGGATLQHRQCYSRHGGGSRLGRGSLSRYGGHAHGAAWALPAVDKQDARGRPPHCATSLGLRANGRTLTRVAMPLRLLIRLTLSGQMPRPVR